MFYSLFRQLDLFGKPVKLNFNGKEKSKSLAGACVSITFFGFVLWAIYQVGHDIIYRDDPKIITSQGFNENPDPMIISPDTFNFAFGLQDPNTYAHYINESIYTIDIKHSQLIREIKQDGTVDMKWRRTVLILERCTTAHFRDLGQSFHTIELNELYCLQKDQPELSEIIIQGVFESPIFQDISINFKPCDPNSSIIPCAPQDVLNQMLGSGYFAVYYTNRAINPKNYSNPSIGYRDSYYTAISNSYSKEITLSLSHLEVKSDMGWLTEEQKIDHFIKADSLRENINFKADTTTMLTFLLRIGKITTHYERSYTKVQDIFAQANGLVTAGLIMVLLLMAPYSKVKFYERLINELFDIRALQQNNKAKDQVTRTKAIRKKSASRTVFTKTPAFKPKGETTLNIPKVVGNSSFSSPFNPKRLMDPYKSTNTDEDHNSHDKPVSYIQSRFESKFKRKKTYHLSIFGPKHSESNQTEEKEEKIINFSDDEPFPPNVKASCNNLKEQGFLDRGNPSYTYHPLQDKPRAVQPQIKVLEHYEAAGPEEIQTVLGSLIDQGEQNTKKSQLFSEESQQNEIITNHDMIDLFGKLDNKDGHNVVKTYAKSLQDFQEVKEEVDDLGEELPARLNKESNRINISFGEYLCSFIWKSQRLKQKFSLLEEGTKRIEERLDIFNVLKKFREVDKLKLLLLENEQYILFDTLPKPELSVKSSGTTQAKESFSHNQLREAKFINEKRRNDLIVLSYKNLKKKRENTMIDTKLLEIYDDILAS